jgi:hypothetical protein
LKNLEEIILIDDVVETYPHWPKGSKVGLSSVEAFMEAMNQPVDSHCWNCLGSCEKISKNKSSGLLVERLSRFVVDHSTLKFLTDVKVYFTPFTSFPL